jgi:hypothetical protein
MDNPEKLATLVTQDEDKQTKTQHNMCWTPLHAKKHRQRKQDTSHHTNNRGKDIVFMWNVDYGVVVGGFV